ncbi:MAG TPA: FAD-dependent monooxygenase [Intrasporangium sp.]|nr:FAD-dependent monooxygenase [Intrasporangium sp.]
MESIKVAVVGAGQAGTATSHELSERGVEHVVLEAERPGFSWHGVGTAPSSSRRTIPSGCPVAAVWATTHTATFRVPGSSNTSACCASGSRPCYSGWARMPLTAERISAALRAPAV